MQDVSQKWIKANEETLRPRGYLNISLDIADPNGYAGAVITSSGSALFSDGLSIAAVPSTPYPPLKTATLEENLFLLDGNMHINPSATTGSAEDVQERNGFISQHVSTNTCLFIPDVWFRITFEEGSSQSIKDVVITWGEAFGSFAVDFDVVGSDGTSYTYTNNRSVVSTLSVDFKNITSITIIIHKWSLPNQRARISKVFLATVLTFTNNTIYDFSEKRHSDPVMSVLPSSEVSFSFKNTDGLFDPSNPDSLYPRLSEKQAVEVTYGFYLGGQPEVIASGIYFLSKWNIPQNGVSATITASDILDYFTDTYYHADKYDGSAKSYGAMLESLLMELCGNGKFPPVPTATYPFVIDPVFYQKTTVGRLPICTYREAILNIVQAVGGVMLIGRDGILRFTMKTTEMTDYKITNYVQYEYPSLEVSKILGSILVKVYTYTQETVLQTICTTTVNNDTTVTNKRVFIQLGDYYSISGITITNGFLVSYVAYSQGVDITYNSNYATTTIEVKGYKINRSANNYSSEEYDQHGVVQSINNGLITDEAMAQYAIDHYSPYLRDRKKYTSSLRIDPRVDPLDDITLENKYSDSNPEIVTDVEVNYDGSFNGRIIGRIIDHA